MQSLGRGVILKLFFSPGNSSGYWGMGAHIKRRKELEGANNLQANFNTMNNP